jgi:4-hydroxy-tetrahydrodipicolinate reductase
MVKIAVAGAAGRMGGRICALAGEHDELELAGAFERQGHEAIGRDVGEVIGTRATGVVISGSVHEALDAADVLIDFTSPSSSLENLEAVASRGKAAVIGTTGFSAEDLGRIGELAKTVPCVQASNMSVGINLLLKVIRDIAGALGEDYDVEIIEAHHKHKKDAPSGTALMLARAAAEALGRDLEKDAVYARHGMIGERTAKEIGIQTVRAGDIVGEHTVLFGGMGERVEVTHRASSRDTFARGALRAALWVQGKGAGLYSMQDVLGLSR